MKELTQVKNLMNAKFARKHFQNQGTSKDMKELTGEKRFRCKTCSKTFSLSHNLKSHEKIHAREKNHMHAILARQILRG